jgi:hypothetical protein
MQYHVPLPSRFPTFFAVVAENKRMENGSYSRTKVGLFVEVPDDIEEKLPLTVTNDKTVFEISDAPVR